MYARDLTTPERVTVPAPTVDSPAAGTTGNPNGGAGAAVFGRPGRKATGYDTEHAVLVWALGGLAVYIGMRGMFRNGGVA